MQLNCVSQRTRIAEALAIEHGRLMRVLPIAEILCFFVSKGDLLGELDIQLTAQIVCNQRIIDGSMLIDLVHERLFDFDILRTGLDVLNDRFIIGRIDHHIHILKVLCCTAQHGRPADINVLYGLLELNAGLLNRRP